MLEEKKVIEECLYCHGQIKLGNKCAVCGDTKLAESLRPDPPPRPTPTLHPGFIDQLKIAGV